MTISNEDLKIARSKKYICRSKINKVTLKEMHLSAFSVSEVCAVFDDLPGVIVVVGNPLNSRQQRHVKFVLRHELYRAVVKGR